MKNLAMIACVSKDGGLGLNNDLLWHIPGDMKFFRQTTSGHPVIMGGKTFRSIGRPLPGRENVVLSRSRPDVEGVIWMKDLAELKDYLRRNDDLKFIIGGASLYQEFLPETETIYLTEVDAIKPASVYFPEFQKDDFQVEVLAGGEFEGANYQIKKYQRK